MPNPDNQVVDKSRDEIRRKLKNDPGEGAYDYVIKRKVGGGDGRDRRRSENRDPVPALSLSPLGLAARVPAWLLSPSRRRWSRPR